METLHSAGLLVTPVKSDADVLARVACVIDEQARKLRALWLFFLDGNGLQNEVVVPIDCIPDRPDPQLVASVCYIVSQLLSGAEPGSEAGSEAGSAQPDGRAQPDGSAIITLSRPGRADLIDTDRRWLRALQQGAARHRSPIRMLCLATPAGVRELGPVNATA